MLAALMMHVQPGARLHRRRAIPRARPKSKPRHLRPCPKPASSTPMAIEHPASWYRPKPARALALASPMRPDFRPISTIWKQSRRTRAVHGRHSARAMLACKRTSLRESLGRVPAAARCGRSALQSAHPRNSWSYRLVARPFRGGTLVQFRLWSRPGRHNRRRLQRAPRPCRTAMRASDRFGRKSPSCALRFSDRSKGAQPGPVPWTV